MVSRAVRELRISVPRIAPIGGAVEGVEDVNALDHSAPLPEMQPERPAPMRQTAVTLADASSILAQAKARVAALDVEIARLEGCRTERDVLAAMLKAAEAK
jgi:hypothetical protein